MPSNQISKLLQLSNQCVDEVGTNLKTIQDTLAQFNMEDGHRQKAQGSCTSFNTALTDVRSNLSDIEKLCSAYQRGADELEPVKQSMQKIDSCVTAQLETLNEMVRGIITKAKETPGTPEAAIGTLVTESRNTVDSCLQLKELLVTIDSELFAVR